MYRHGVSLLAPRFGLREHARLCVHGNVQRRFPFLLQPVLELRLHVGERLLLELQHGFLQRRIG
jgi:hypothetical protein